MSGAAAAVPGLALLSLYDVGGIGAGSVKMRAAFGAWVGCALAPGPAVLLVGLGTAAGLLLLIVQALAIIWARNRWKLRGSLAVTPCQPGLSLGVIAGVSVPILAGCV